MLRWRALLPSGLVRKIYLPVGNPETQWLYGVAFEGYQLHFEARILYTLYCILHALYFILYTLYGR